jgi:hypothetical protein
VARLVKRSSLRAYPLLPESITTVRLISHSRRVVALNRKENLMLMKKAVGQLPFSGLVRGDGAKVS